MWRSRCGRTVALVLPWLISFSAAAQDSALRVEVTGTRVSMVPPSAFEVADRFPGFVGPNGASIQVTEIAGPFKEVVGTARHQSGYPVAIYLVVVADGVGHLQLLGTCRLDDEPKYLPAFRQMVENLSLGKQ